MWRSSPTPEAIHLSNYWNALNQNAPAAELDRLASLVDPTLVAAITRARALHQVRRPDPRFAALLEQKIMARYPTPISTVPTGLPPSHTAPRTLVPPVRSPGTPNRLGRELARGVNVFLVMLLILGTVAGIWLFNQRDNGTHILAPDDATPTAEVTPSESFDVPMYRGNPGRTGVFPGPSLFGSPVELWTLQVGEPINLGAAVVDGVVYFPAGTRGFEARDAMTGNMLLWTYATAAPAVSAPAVADGLAYVIDGDGTLYAINTSDGTEVWQFANTNIRSSMLPLDGVVYVVSPEGTSFALDAATGSINWQAELGAEAAGGMAVVDGLLFQGNAAGVMTAFDVETGEVRWTFQNDEARNNATVTVANGQIYFTVSGGDINAMYAVDIATGELTWRQEQGPGLGFISTTATADLLYSVAEDGQLHALDAATGETVWTYQLLAFVRSIPVLVDDTLYVADNGGFVRALDPVTGVQFWEYPIAGEVDLGWPVVSNGVLYIGTSFGNFYAITGSGSIAAMSDPTPTHEPEASPQATDSLLPTLIWETSEEIDLDDSNLGGIAIDADGVIHVPDLIRGVITMISPDGEFVGEWGSPGDGPGEFSFNAQTFASGSLTVDADGNFYVVDGSNNRIQKFDPQRSFLREWGSSGSGEGEFRTPSAAFVSGDRIYVTDAMNHRVQIFDLDGTFVATWGEFGTEPGQLNTPCAIAVMPDGTVYVAEEATRRVQHFTADGEYLGELAQPDPGSGVVYSLAVDPVGNLWAASSLPRRVMAFTPDGALIVEFDDFPDAGFFDTAGSLAFDTEGNLVFASSNGKGWTYAERTDGRGRVLKIAVPSALAATPVVSGATANIIWESSDDVALLDHAAGVTLTPDGTIWVADGANSRFQVFDQEGTLLFVWGEKGAGEGQFNFVRANGDGLGGVAFAPDGSFYVVDTGNTRIQHFDVDGNFLNMWGSFGTDTGQFVSPGAIAIDSQGNVYVDDDMHDDIQKFAPDGTWLLTIGESGSAPGQLDKQGFIAIAPDDTLWVNDANNMRLQHFASDGTLIAAIPFTEIPGQPVLIGSLAFDAAGRLYLADNGGEQMIVINTDGTLAGTWADETIHPNSTGMAIGADGAIFLADWEGGTLYRYELDPPLDPIAIPIATPAG